MPRPEEKPASLCVPSFVNSEDPAEQTSPRVCPVCGGSLIDIRHKLQCERCHTICETCCEGGRG